MMNEEQVIKRDGWTYWSKRKLVWLSRINHCQGFGVQSPWAFKMVCNVINGREHHEAYDSLKGEYPRLDAVTRKLCQLFLRLSYDRQPQTVVDFGAANGVYVDYIKAGCEGAKCFSVPYNTSEGEIHRLLEIFQSVDMVMISPYGNFHRFAQLALQNVHDGTVFMLDGIHESKNAKILWNEILKEWQDIVTFDLYYCGLVFFASKRYKQNYIINF
ncbi:MAG: hypothetical protein LUC91_09880 [Prevotella sp.]|nr:hypothetical protein [Prevotella sp.]